MILGLLGLSFLSLNFLERNGQMGEAEQQLELDGTQDTDLWRQLDGYFQPWFLLDVGAGAKLISLASCT